VKSNDLALAKLKEFGSNVSGLTKLRFFFNTPITGIQAGRTRSSYFQLELNWSRSNFYLSIFEILMLFALYAICDRVQLYI